MKKKLIYKRTVALSIVFIMVITFGLSPAFGAVTPGKVSTWASQSVSKGSSYGVLPPLFEEKDMTKPVSRQEFAQMVILLYEKIKGTKITSLKSNPFKDTSDLSVVKAYSLGIVKGQGDGIFNPTGLLTREEAASMLNKAYIKSTGNHLTATGAPMFADDKGISTYARPAIYYMTYKGFIQGTGNNRFTPKGTITGEQVVTMSVRILDEVWKTEDKLPDIEYFPGMKATTLEEAQDIILEARKSLFPEISIEMSRDIYEELLTSQFTENKGIKVHYIYNTNEKKLRVSLIYNTYVQILALTENYIVADLYASSMAKDLNIIMNDVLKKVITGDLGDYEKERAIHDYMVKNYIFDTSITIYDLEHPSRSVEGLLYYKKGICQAYAEVFDLFMKKMGITSQMVWGKTASEDHVWNMVKLSGQWYMVDVTWDDPIPDRGSRVSYDYFNLTDEQLELTHIWNNEQYPKAEGTQFGN